HVCLRKCVPNVLDVLVHLGGWVDVVNDESVGLELFLNFFVELDRLQVQRHADIIRVGGRPQERIHIDHVILGIGRGFQVLESVFDSDFHISAALNTEVFVGNIDDDRIDLHDVYLYGGIVMLEKMNHGA